LYGTTLHRYGLLLEVSEGALGFAVGVLDSGMIQSVFDKGRIRTGVLSGAHPFFCLWFVRQRMAAKYPAKLERLLDDLYKAGLE